MHRLKVGNGRAKRFIDGSVATALAAAIEEALISGRLCCQAAELGKRVSKEDGVTRAVRLVEAASGKA